MDKFNTPLMQKTEAEQEQLFLRNLKKYNNLDTLEQYALYMGMAQILEAKIKVILASQFNQSAKTIEQLPLGKTIPLLKKQGVRDDLIILLDEIRSDRNTMAHEFLANLLISTDLGFDPESKIVRELSKYICNLEKVILFWDWCIKNNALMPIDDN